MNDSSHFSPNTSGLVFLLAVSKHLRHGPGKSHVELAESFRQNFLKLPLLRTCNNQTALAAYELMLMVPILPNCLVLHNAGDSLGNLTVVDDYHDIPKLENFGESIARGAMRHEGSLRGLLDRHADATLQDSARSRSSDSRDCRGIWGSFVKLLKKGSRPNIQHLGVV